MDIPASTAAWLSEPDNPAVACIFGREFLGKSEKDVAALWARRNEYPPVAAILKAEQNDGSWMPPSQDYRKYQGNLWQIILLGEMRADGSDERVQKAAGYAFSRQLDDGSWSASNRNPKGSIPCLTANVGRSLARLGFARDERVAKSLAYIAGIHAERGFLDCLPGGTGPTLNRYCHMLAPKVLLLLGEVPRDFWPDGAEALRDECVRVLRDKEVFKSLPKGSREYFDKIYTEKIKDTDKAREDWIAEHGPLEYGPKPGWLRFGFPLSYNSDVLEALAALAGAGETMRSEYEPALQVVRDTADRDMRWKLKNSFNGKFYADVEKKGEPSKWLTLRALQVLRHFTGNAG